MLATRPRPEPKLRWRVPHCSRLRRLPDLGVLKPVPEPVRSTGGGLRHCCTRRTVRKPSASDRGPQMNDDRQCPRNARVLSGETSFGEVTRDLLEANLWIGIVFEWARDPVAPLTHLVGFSLERTKKRAPSAD